MKRDGGILNMTIMTDNPVCRDILRLVIAGLFAAVVFPGSGSGAAPAPDRHAVTIVAAANLKPALDEIVQGFTNANLEVAVRVAYTASGNAFAQIVNQAPFDVFLSADTLYPDKIVALGLASQDDVFNYAVGRLVVWTLKDSALDPVKTGLQTIGAASIRHVSIADPAKAPYGRAAEEAMRKAGLYEGVKNKLVRGDNVMQAGQFVESKAADIGLIPLSLALAPSYKAVGKYAVVPAEAHAPIVQAGVILKRAKDRASAVAFRAFLLRDGKATGGLKRYGYELPPASTL